MSIKFKTYQHEEMQGQGLQNPNKIIGQHWILQRFSLQPENKIMLEMESSPVGETFTCGWIILCRTCCSRETFVGADVRSVLGDGVGVGATGEADVGLGEEVGRGIFVGSTAES